MHVWMYARARVCVFNYGKSKSSFHGRNSARSILQAYILSMLQNNTCPCSYNWPCKLKRWVLSLSLSYSLILTSSLACARVSLRFSTSELYLGELWYYPTDWRTYERMDVRTDVRTDSSYQLEPEGFYYPVRYVWRPVRHGSSRVQFDGSIYVDIRKERLARWSDDLRVYLVARSTAVRSTGWKPKSLKLIITEALLSSSNYHRKNVAMSVVVRCYRRRGKIITSV